QPMGVAPSQGEARPPPPPPGFPPPAWLTPVFSPTAPSFPADILLLDEWLSVVDENFSAKAEQRLLKLVQLAAIVIIASHDQGLLRRTCTRIISLDHGRVVNMAGLGAEPEPQSRPEEMRA